MGNRPEKGEAPAEMSLRDLAQELAELKAMISSLTMLHQSVYHSVLTGEHYTPTSERRKEILQPLFLEPGGSVQVHPGKDSTGQVRQTKFPYLHWCGACLDVFRSRSKNPKRCGKCKTPYWRKKRGDT